MTRLLNSLIPPLAAAPEFTLFSEPNSSQPPKSGISYLPLWSLMFYLTASRWYFSLFLLYDILTLVSPPFRPPSLANLFFLPRFWTDEVFPLSIQPFFRLVNHRFPLLSYFPHPFYFTFYFTKPSFPSLKPSSVLTPLLTVSHLQSLQFSVPCDLRYFTPVSFWL